MSAAVRLVASAWLLLSGAAFAQAIQLVSGQSEIAFTTRQMGVPVEGRFTRFSAEVTLDAKRPDAGSVRIAIDTGSARFGAPETDTEVKKPVWLNVLAFPQAGFQSSVIKATGPGRFDVAGKLTIKGSVHDVTVPVQLVQAGAISTASGAFTVNRLAFKIGEAEWADPSLVADEVQVKFKLVLSGLAPL
ncbi:MAG TPA: YceI family protein [Rubrivivax sp.]